MRPSETDRRMHWQDVYSTRRACDVSWFQAEPEHSLKLIRRTLVGREAPIVDVGGGASTLVDHLLRDGFGDITVLDIAASGLEQSRKRLGGAARRIDWIEADVTAWRPPRVFQLWHDRAVLHFLTDPRDQHAYAETLRAALSSGDWAIIGGFAPHGPTRCSGLDVMRHDAASLAALLGEGFALMETHGEVHVTPQGREQAFRYHLFQRK